MNEIYVKCAKKENFPIDWQQPNVKFGTDGNAPVKCKRTAFVDRMINNGFFIVIEMPQEVVKPVENKAAVNVTKQTINKELTIEK